MRMIEGEILESFDHPVENLGAVRAELTADDLREIERGFSNIALHGARLSEAHLQLIDR